ncbi:TetR family transcriptional regulator [Streptomyces sp. F63]|uniref:TetR family transcriptional regulator n=1 Tax=Streptomyces sp. F63 TaxID=2824887 RepID=UPI001B374D67|nr:TetR family transcriptional regulator [Streptomyces sp. F63]MBQ0986503.1 TetR family transcriptional regulator [Streptomyces sp. F63]
MTRYRESVRSMLKERILDAAYEQVAAGGWDRLRMTHVAATAGVSRQTVYTEYGSKTALGEALMLREVERFLLGIQEELLARPGDLRAAVVAAVGYTLRSAADNPLLKAILTSARGAQDDLLALLTTRSEPVLDIATAMLTEYAKGAWHTVDPESRALAVEAVVRLTVSHIVQPTTPVEPTAERIAEITVRVAGI